MDGNTQTIREGLTTHKQYKKTMQAWRLKLDFDQDRVLVDQRMTRLMLK